MQVQRCQLVFLAARPPQLRVERSEVGVEHRLPRVFLSRSVWRDVFGSDPGSLMWWIRDLFSVNPTRCVTVVSRPVLVPSDKRLVGMGLVWVAQCGRLNCSRLGDGFNDGTVVSVHATVFDFLGFWDEA